MAVECQLTARLGSAPAEVPRTGDEDALAPPPPYHRWCGSGLFLLQRSSLGLGRSSSVLPSENLRYSTVCSWPCLAFFYFCFWEEAQSSLILDQHLDGLLQLLLSQCQFHKSLRRRLVLNWIIPLDSELTHSLCLHLLLGLLLGTRQYEYPVG